MNIKYQKKGKKMSHMAVSYAQSGQRRQIRIEHDLQQEETKSTTQAK
jgi:hypothetical protein